MIKSWVPKWATHYSIKNQGNHERHLEIKFLTCNERVPATHWRDISELAKDLAIHDVKQNIDEIVGIDAAYDKPITVNRPGLPEEAKVALGIITQSSDVTFMGGERTKYHRAIGVVNCECGKRVRIWADVYDVLGAFTGHYNARVKPIIDHLMKKLLAGGERGHKDLKQDMTDVRDGAVRAIETIDEWV